MALIDDIIKIEIKTDAVAQSRKDFGTALIFGNSVPALDPVVKSYATLAAVLVDFANNTPEYITAQKFFSQALKPPTVLIGQKPDASTYVQAYNAIQAINSDFYVVMMVTGDNAAKKTISDVVQTESRIFVVSSQEPEVLTNADGSLPKLLGAVHRSCAIYNSQATAEQTHGALVGALLPLTAGSATWAFKKLNGITADKLTGAQQTVLKNTHVNYYTDFGGDNVTIGGTMLDGTFIDTVQGLDWLEQHLKENIASVLKGTNKIDYNNDGIAQIDNAIRAALQEGVNRKIINKSFTVSVPDYLTVPANDKAARILRNVSFAATLTGAIHGIDKISGTVTA